MSAATQAPGFIFDATGGGSALTYEQLQARRKVYDAMVARQRGRAPQNIGEGLQAFGEGILAGIEGRQLRNAEAESAKTQAGIWDKLGALGPGGAGAGFGSATGAISDGRYTVADVGSGSAEPLSTTPDDGDIYTSFLDTVRTGDPEKGLSGITNPYGLAAVAATGKHESGYSARNAFGNWSDPSESGEAGQAGGVLSWRAERLASMRDFVAKNGGDPRRPDPRLQAQFFLAEDPSLVARLNAAESPEEAQSLMNGAWRFAGYDRPGGEAARRTATARSYLSQFAGNQPQQAPVAPVQVASLDPSAGMAAAPGGPQPQPANVPVPTPSATAREALEKAFAAQAASGTEPYTGPALSDPNAMSSIAPVGMPGATPEADAAIQQYHAANGSTPMQYQGGTAPAGAAPVAGDPSQGVPVPTPRPEMQAQAAAPAGIPQQAVASSAMAQQPAPFDPVNGTSMGGNTGAADAARAAYLEGEPANRYQRIAQAMEARGITVPQAAPSPAVQQVAEAQQTGQARGRFQQLMSVVVNPAASPEQRQYAAGLLEQDRQYQTQQQTRAYDMWKVQQGWNREDQRNAITDRREDARLQMELGKAAREERQPINVNGTLVDPQTFQPVYQAPKDGFTLQPGETRFDGSGNQIAAGGAKPGYRPLSPSDASQLGLPPGNYQAGPDGKIEVLGGAKPGAAFENEQGLRKEYGSTAEVKEFADIRSSYERLRASAQTGSGPGDLGVIFGYMKMLDPGSVVREGEFATAETAQGVPERVINLYNKLLTGERLTQDQRKSFVTAAGDLYGQVDRKMQGINQRYEGIARQYGIDPTRVIQPLPTYEALNFGEPAAAPPAQGYTQAPVPMPAPMPAQAAPPRQAPETAQQQPAQTGAPRQRWDRGAPVRQQPETQPAAVVPRRATNPQTGQIIELRNGQWVPVQ